MIRFSVAPMMDWTDRHCRMLHRKMSARTRLYTEMVTTGAILHGPRDRLLEFDAREQPVAVQLGGSDPGELAEVASICEAYGYSEINLNVGCPSDRVQNGAFGACLMAQPRLVANCVAAIKESVGIPVTVKCRIGIDDQDPVAALDAIADEMVDVSADALIVHARKAWLKGLSPKENRDIPPLDYALVYRLKDRLPSLPIAINGGIVSLKDAKLHLQHVDGVMIGRAAYQNPQLLLDVDADIFGDTPVAQDAFAVVESMIPYIEARLTEGVRLHSMTRHMLGLFQGLAGARAFRRHLATEAVLPGARANVLLDAVDFVRQALESRAA